MTSPANGHVTFEAWQAIERASEVSEVRHELVGGTLYAMTGASKRHNRLAFAVGMGLDGPARAAGRRVSILEVALWTGEQGYYPDVMVDCGEDTDEYVETEPCLVVEVLSPSTATTDQREKLAAYKALPSLLAYVIADPEQPRLQVHERRGDLWTLSVLGKGDTLRLTCPRVEISVDSLYEVAA